MRLVHGGRYTVAIETFATIGAYEAIMHHGQQAVGVANSTDLLRPHRTARLDVDPSANHQGRTQRLWPVEIRRTIDVDVRGG